MKKLTSAQRSSLKSQAHHLEPIVLIGKNGVTKGTLHAINKALESRELIKIKFREYKDQKHDISKNIISETSSHEVGIIGHTLILYKQNPDPEKQIYTI